MLIQDKSKSDYLNQSIENSYFSDPSTSAILMMQHEHFDIFMDETDSSDENEDPQINDQRNRIDIALLETHERLSRELNKATTKLEQKYKEANQKAEDLEISNDYLVQQLREASKKLHQSEKIDAQLEQEVKEASQKVEDSAYSNTFLVQLLKEANAKLKQQSESSITSLEQKLREANQKVEESEYLKINLNKADVKLEQKLNDGNDRNINMAAELESEMNTVPIYDTPAYNGEKTFGYETKNYKLRLVPKFNDGDSYMAGVSQILIETLDAVDQVISKGNSNCNCNRNFNDNFNGIGNVDNCSVNPVNSFNGV
ncbi:unnamed protein product [Candida verbasci]|uniref:Uncharacterized protein n=1 Tax=Candida verbasci TaxID=1227364 RepID=A0A9W4X9K5_9ASCO|nr:unnamed protein product [Candida verbasci]